MSLGRKFRNNYRLDLILKIYLAIIAAIITSSILNIWMITYLKWNPILTHFASLVLGGLVTIFAVFHLAKREGRPGEKIKQSLKMMGEGKLCRTVRLDSANMMAEIAESMNRANQELSGRLKVVMRNLDRLAEVEDELSVQLKGHSPNDPHTKNLIYMMKISTSRLKNDLESFSLEEENVTGA
ncbi:hypothetical protein TRIP_C60488 [Candidatus Zixiibacteriota bacterium]|nr:hypothetical protein TRIP_C60488 [candidate division Zixibacteria bacterium]